MANNHTDTERRLWDAADDFRANSDLKSSEYAVPVLGLIFLRYADHRFSVAEEELKGKGSGRRKIGKEDYQAKGVMYLPAEARFSHLLSLPEGENIGKAINEAMKAVEAENVDLKGVLPRTYTKIDNAILVSLLKNFSQIEMDTEGDQFGKIYEYFLGNFARAEGQRGGEFFTPTSLVKLIVEIIEPYHGRIYDPACGSGGMFAQSAEFIKAHQMKKGSDPDSAKHPQGRSGYRGPTPFSNDPSREISCYGQERVGETRQLCMMNLAVHSLSGDIRLGNSYYEDPHESLGKFDFVMANPPFNVDKVDKEKIKDDPRYPFGMPRADNANYLWIQRFYSSLSARGRAGFVMANSAADARQSEMEIRKALLQSHAVDVMAAIGPNFFYTVTLPCTLWFLDKGKTSLPGSGSPRPASGRGAGGEGPRRKDTVLFIDARHTFRQVDRAHRKFSPKQIEYLANIVRLYRGEKPEFVAGEDEQVPGDDPDLKAAFPKLKYADVAGLCRVATLAEIEEQGWSLNPGRYVGVADREEDDFVFAERLEELNEELEVLNSEAGELEERIANNVAKLLEASV
ncbi:type I restriction-modification system subunit M [Allorhodopirellula solitaria]|uniref:site-specific DNA-methyltransferase (adenine-specific) n=1 Tax=Allorhodopirellula solitaria TaxID=2527987 RepID=A0A5C5YHF1_9BACT|nr:class I SAM-dependent DNA methyltransferase [Allorhodopirellula solitaria]TWT74055.1 putative type I restriction enzymeP M protein [Allorhodopirellula solitaria]